MICGAPTIEAHLLPKSFVREIYYDLNSDEKHMIHHVPTGRKNKSNTGKFDKNILCGKCDNVLNHYEDSSYRLLKRLRTIKIGNKNGNDIFIDEGIYPFKVREINNFVRFACGILWKYASISPQDISYIKIGKYKKILEEICFHNKPIPENINVYISRDVLSFAAFNDPNEVYYYCSPSIYVLDSRHHNLMGWFSVSNFTIYIKMGEFVSVADVPDKCWMRGKKSCFFNVSMESIQVNMGVLESVSATRDDLARLNKRIHSKSVIKKNQ